jgi:hypothetical protein
VPVETAVAVAGPHDRKRARALSLTTIASFGALDA